MSPEAGLQKQIEMYRQMTGRQRMEIGFGLHELACEISRAGIRAQHPQATEDEVERMLVERIQLAHRL